MATTPVPVLKVQWDGTRGIVRWYCIWAGADGDLLDEMVVDLSSLAPAPHAIKLRRINMIVNGNFSATLEYDDIATGVLTLVSASNRLTWNSGDKFDTNWVTYGNKTMTCGDLGYVTITSVDSTTQITETEAFAPGDDGAYSYTLDEFIDRFIGQANVTYQFLREYDDGPSNGLCCTQGSANLVGDLIITTSGAAAGDELTFLATFERS